MSRIRGFIRFFRPPGGPGRFPWRDLVQFALLVAALLWLTVEGARELEYNWQWYRIPKYLFGVREGHLIPGPLLRGLWVTLKITGVSLLLATAMGLTAAFLRLSGSILCKVVARIYVEVIRNTPLLVQIFFIYFVLAPVFRMDRFTSAVLALSLFEGAYASEIFRAGILSIPAGQWESAFSLGMGLPSTYRHVILPQAVRRVLPPLTSQAISLVKDSALVSTIAIYDLTMEAQAIISETYLTFELWLTVAAVYLAVTLTLSAVVHVLQRRLGPGGGVFDG